MGMPHNITDLYLAPVVLKLDAELEALRDKTEDELHMFVALSTNREPRTISERRKYFVEAVTRFHEMHGWVATCHPRGLRLANDAHNLVLGVPPNVYTYLKLANESVDVAAA